MDIFVYLFNCITYSLALSIVIYFFNVIKIKKNILIYFIINLFFDVICYGALEQYSMLIMGAAVIVYMLLFEKRKPITALLTITTSMILVLLPILFFGNSVTLLFGSFYGTVPYNIIMGILLTAMAFLFRSIVTNISKKISNGTTLTSILTISHNLLFLFIFDCLLPWSVNESYLTLYAICSFAFVFSTLFWIYILIYLSKIEMQKTIQKRELEIAMRNQADIMDKHRQYIEFTHYYTGLLKSMEGLKIISLTVLILLYVVAVIGSGVIRNLVLCAVVCEAVNLLPVTYKIFKQERRG